MVELLRREQDLDYYRGLLIDLKNETKKDRDQERQVLIKLLQTKVPQSVEGLFRPEEVRLLRINPSYLTPQEKLKVDKLKGEINRIRDGGCYNTADETGMFKLRIPGLAFTFCFSIKELFEKGLVNDDYMFADVIITLPNSTEQYRYPLTQEQFEDLIGQAISLGLDPDLYKKMPFPELDKIRQNINRLMHM